MFAFTSVVSFVSHPRGRLSAASKLTASILLQICSNSVDVADQLEEWEDEVGKEWGASALVHGKPAAAADFKAASATAN